MTCRMEEVGLRSRAPALRAGTLTFPTFTHIMEDTHCRAGECLTHFCPQRCVSLV